MAFQCLECGKLFKTIRSAERASERGCPRCGGVDIDIAIQEQTCDFEKRVIAEELARRVGVDWNDDANALDVTFDKF